jgi:hypothetical protein
MRSYIFTFTIMIINIYKSVAMIYIELYCER